MVLVKYHSSFICLFKMNIEVFARIRPSDKADIHSSFHVDTHTNTINYQPGGTKFRSVAIIVHVP